jgi:hypothetical protein
VGLCNVGVLLPHHCTASLLKSETCFNVFPAVYTRDAAALCEQILPVVQIGPHVLPLCMKKQYAFRLGLNFDRFTGVVGEGD